MTKAAVQAKMILHLIDYGDMGNQMDRKRTPDCPEPQPDDPDRPVTPDREPPAPITEPGSPPPIEEPPPPERKRIARFAPHQTRSLNSRSIWQVV